VERGYEVLIGATSYSPEKMTQCVRRMVDRGVDGVAVMTFGMDQKLLQELATRNIPLVSVGSPNRLGSGATIEVDFKKGITEAVSHLADLGHREIAFITGPLSTTTSRLRRRAYLRAMKALGIKTSPALIVEGDHTMEGGYAATLLLLKRKWRPSAILCSNDMTAIGSLHAASARRVRVPHDLSIVGFDDIHLAQFTVPPLTTVRMSGTELATLACGALLQMIGKEAHFAAKRLVVKTELIVRQTTMARYNRTQD